MSWKKIGCVESESIQGMLGNQLQVGATVTDCDGYYHGERFISTEWGLHVSNGWLRVLKTVNRGPIEKNVHEDFRWVGDVQVDD
jgi:hypothetical protein